MLRSEINETQGFNPAKAFNKRRYIYASVDDLQRQEHDLFARIAKETRTCKRELLELWSTWLLDQASTSDSHPQAEELSGCSMAEWLGLQTQFQSLKVECDRLKLIAEQAESEYRKVDRFKVGKWFGTEKQKAEAKRLANVSRSKAAHYNDAYNNLLENTVKRQAFGKVFLRGCLSKIGTVNKFAIFGRRSEELVIRMTHFIETEWTKHLLSLKSALTDIESCQSELRKIYGINGERS